MDKIKAVIQNSPWVIALIYLIIGIVWIAFSDQFVLTLWDDADSLTEVQSYKGFFFVAASSFLVFLLVRKSNSILGGVIEDLQVANNKFKATIEHAPVGIAHHKPDEKWIEVNQTLCDLLGYSRDELMKCEFSDFVHPDDLQKGRQLDSELIRGDIKNYEIEKRYIRKDGTQFEGMVRKSAVYNGKNVPLYLVVVLEDITKQKMNEKTIKKSLQEKEVLLAEVHHRVRNNLALISAFLDLESRNVKNKQVERVLGKNKVRIKCLSLIHDAFSDNNAGGIYFDKLLHQLIDFFQSFYSTKLPAIKIEKNISPVQLNINLAIPASLLFTELVINSAPNKFEDDSQPVLNVFLGEESGRITFRIFDNWTQPEQSELQNKKTFPSDIIQALVAQVKGKLETGVEQGKSMYSLRFNNIQKKGPGSSIN
ncbi:MAG: PAS domain S-box protein [Balneolaceae bacterium]